MRFPSDMVCRAANSPEVRIAGYAFLLNFAWEVGQMPFYRCFDTLDGIGALRLCTLASVGDAAMAVTTFWAVASVTGTREWFRNPTWAEELGFVGSGVTMTVLFEWLATEVLGRWQYAERMPTLPVLGVGLLPLLQWTILPPLVLRLAFRHGEMLG